MFPVLRISYKLRSNKAYSLSTFWIWICSRNNGCLLRPGRRRVPCHYIYNRINDYFFLYVIENNIGDYVY